MSTKTVEVTKQPNKYVTVTQKKLVSTVTEPADQTIEIHDPGVAGPANTLTIGTVTVADTASASITGTAPNQVLNLVYPASVRHVHTQGTASTTWTINHALGGYPSVSVVDSARTVVFGEVTYLSTTQVVVNFSAAFSGFAYLT
jgi:hypothetical protein